MKRIEEVCRLSGVSRRTLQYYDNEGILPVKRSEENYRLYDETAMPLLWKILCFKKMEFDLKELKNIIQFLNNQMVNTEVLGVENKQFESNRKIKTFVTTIIDKTN